VLHRLHDVRLENHLVMIRSEFAGDDAGVVGFVKIIFFETDREGLDRAGTGARHQGNNRGRIGSAAEKCAKRDVGNEADTGSLVEPAL